MIPSQSPSPSPLAEFQRDAAARLLAMRSSGRPEVLTVEGRPELIVQTAEAYQTLLTRVEHCESALAIHRGLGEIARGNATPLEAAEKRMRDKLLKAKPKD